MLKAVTTSGQHSFTRESALAWLAPRHNAAIAAAPEAWQCETRDRAARLAAAAPGSYLAQHVRTLYGVRPTAHADEL